MRGCCHTSSSSVYDIILFRVMICTAIVVMFVRHNMYKDYMDTWGYVKQCSAWLSSIRLSETKGIRNHPFDFFQCLTYVLCIFFRLDLTHTHPHKDTCIHMGTHSYETAKRISSCIYIRRGETVNLVWYYDNLRYALGIQPNFLMKQSIK